MSKRCLNSFESEAELRVGGQSYKYYSLKKFEAKTGKSLKKLPYSLKILLENLLRHEDNLAVKKKDVEALVAWDAKADPKDEIQFTPGRVVLQDFTGVPAVVDLAAMRTVLKSIGGDPSKINPLEPVDLVIDHSVQVDEFGHPKALEKNTAIEFDRNKERYEFLKWGQSAFKNFRVVPPGTGIVHQVNLEFLAHVVMTKMKDNATYAYPDTLVGTDSHTTMINGLGVLGWGVGGIEAEAAMLGQPCTMLIPQVVGFRLKGKLPEGSTATDLVLTATQMLRKKGVVGKFVEYFGPGMEDLSLADRATLANMAPEYGATIGIFPVDSKTTDYLRMTNRDKAADLVETYYKEQGLWYEAGQEEATYSDVLELDLSTVVPSLAGPARPQDRTTLPEVKVSFQKMLSQFLEGKDAGDGVPTDYNGNKFALTHGAVVIAAITSCTNTSNAGVMIAAGILAKKAVAKGLQVKPWVKTSLAPGSKVVTAYLQTSGLLSSLEALKFNVVGYGCTTCIGNSGPLPEPISKAVKDGNLSVASVLSGNRNFEGRVNTQVRANYLASPPLVVAYAIAGNVNLDLSKDPLGNGKDGKPVYLKDVWPTSDEIANAIRTSVTQDQFKQSYSDVFAGDKNWQDIQVAKGELYQWDDESTYIKNPPFFKNFSLTPAPVSGIKNAKALAVLGDSVTTDHISPASSFTDKHPAGKYLVSLGVKPADFNGYGARRGNYEVMARGTFANVRIKNMLLPGVEGPYTKFLGTSGYGEQLFIFDASEKYQKEGTSLIIIAGKEYGTGSSRDWAAKGPMLLGVRAVIAESFERIHRSNLIGMGIIPLQFINGENRESLKLSGEETFDILGLESTTAGAKITVKAVSKDGSKKEFQVVSRIDTPNELEYFKHGGILPYVLRQIASSNN